MAEFQMPKHVSFDLETFFENSDTGKSLPELPNTRIGVLTDFALDDDFLGVRGGISDNGLHDSLARRTGPADSKLVRLPKDMYSRVGTVSGWFDPLLPIDSGLGIISGQIYKYGVNPDAKMDYQQTARCLEMASLALGMLLLRSPAELEKIRDPGNLVFGSAILKRAKRSFGNRIFE